MNENQLFYSANEVAHLLGISVGQTYRLMREWNKALAAKHFLVIPGKIPVQYFNEQIYGGGQAQKIAVTTENTAELDKQKVGTNG